MSKKVAIDVTPLLGEPTGVGVVTRVLFKALSERNDIDLSAFAMSLRGHSDLEWVLPPEMKRSRWPMPAGLLQKIWLKKAAPVIEHWMGSVDVVHGTNFVVPPARSAATLVTVHDLTAVRFPEMCEIHTLSYPALVKTAVKRGAHVHTYSKFVADEVSELLGVPQDVVHVIPAGLEAIVSNVNHPAKNLRYVLAIGTVEPRKNYPMLVSAFDSVARDHPDVSLIIVGGRGWAFDELQQAIGRVSNPAQIRCVGRVTGSERDNLLANAAVLAYPSIYEGFGLPPLEAMRAGVPVVASNAGALPEVLGDAALLVDPFDAAAMAAALDTALSDDAMRSKLIERGTARAAIYQPSVLADQFVALYEELSA